MIFTEKPQDIKLRAGEYMIAVQAWKQHKRIFFQHGFNRLLQSEVKLMKGSHYHGYDETNPRKIWSIEDDPRNHFQIEYLLNKSNPYEVYDRPLTIVDIPPTRYHYGKKKVFNLLKHQPAMTSHMLQRDRPGCIVAGEMGTSKTLSAIIALEMRAQEFQNKYNGKPEIWYVAPKIALKGVQREFTVWGAGVRPDFITPNELVKRITNWIPGEKAPAFVIFDESSFFKTPTSQRSIAAKALADSVRADWPEDSFIVLMSGSPAPKSPVDWYWQAEIACPGFLKEGDVNKFKNTLGIVVQVKGIDGAYPRLVTWRDDETKCNICGEISKHQNHFEDLVQPDEYHAFVKSVNEVTRLHKRLKGLVEVYFKKDCLDLPQKSYRVIEVKPTPSTLRAASMIVRASPTTIEGLTRLRELSDGFQYIDTKTGEKRTCLRCKGSKQVIEYEEIPGTCPNCKDLPAETVLDGGFIVPPVCVQHLPERREVTVSCGRCGGKGEEDVIERETKEGKSPKDQVLVDLLEEHEEHGRIVIYGGFTGTIERVVKICQRQGWHVIQINDSKEIITDSSGNSLPIKDWLTMFQDEQDKYPRVAYVANPGSGGMGITLTASPTIFYYSNTFVGQDRIQSEDRIHREGMDLNLGATIIDCIHLPSDLKVLLNLKQKRDLQSMSLGDFAKDILTATAADRELS